MTHAKDVIVSAIKYRSFHKSSPRGNRTHHTPWRFRVGWEPRTPYSDMGECVVYEFSGSYSRAKRRAKRIAASHGYDRLQVLP